MVRIKKSKNSSVITRILAGLVMFPVAVGIIVYGYPLVDITVLLVGALLAFEWTKLTAKNHNETYSLIYLLALVATTLIYSTPATIATIVCLTVFVWNKAKGEKQRALITLGVAYISIGVGALLWMYYAVGTYGTLWFLFAVCGTDIGGYVIGSTLRGPKLAPKISPNKTWSGLLGGMLLAASLSLLWIIALDYKFGNSSTLDDRIFFAVFAAVIAVVAQCGDLIESAIKRKAGVKDSGTLIPGHGGIFDRIDGMIFAAPFVYLAFILIFSVK